MKKAKGVILLVFLCIFACLFMTACNSTSREDFDKLNNQYNEILEEKNRLEKISNWLDLYNSIEMGKSFNEISAQVGFEYATHSGGSGYTDDASEYKMSAYTWKNKELFDLYKIDENQIVVVFLDNVAIFKQYGNQNFVLDEGTVRFPFPKT